MFENTSNKIAYIKDICERQKKNVCIQCVGK